MLWLKHILRKIFLEDWGMKLIALAITLALWLGVTGLSRPTTQRFSAVPFNVRYSNNIEVTNTPIDQINLVVSGDSRRLAQIKERELFAYIDVSGVPPGDRVIPLTPETVVIALPPGVRLDEIQPRSMAVRIETVEEKEVPVKPAISGELPDGYEIYSETVTPAKVNVRGPSRFIDSLDSVSTELIDVTNKSTDFIARQKSISLGNPKATIVDTSVVDISFRIGEKRVERVYSIPTSGGRRATVVLFGARSLFDDVRTEDIRVDVVKNDSGDDTPKVTLPPILDGRVEIRSAKLRG